MREFRYTVGFEPAEEGGFTVYVYALPGCVSEGDTIEEARAMIQDAMELCMGTLQDDLRNYPH